SGHLSSIVIEEASSQAGISANEIDEGIMGEARQTTESSNIASVAALRAGVPDKATAYTVNRLCATGMKAFTSDAQQLLFDLADNIVAGGTESMSRSPFYLRNARFGGDKPTLVDSNTEAGQQPNEIYGENLGMGITAEKVADKYQISREDQDAF